MANFLDKLLDTKVVQDMLGKQQSVLGIDIGSSSIKVAQVGRRNGRAVLENYGELALGTYAGLPVGQATNLTKVKIKEALNDIFREAKIDIRKAALSIPLGATLLSIVELPKMDKKKMETMVPIEARKYIPVPVSEVMLNWWVLPEFEDEVVVPKAPDAAGEDEVEKVQVLIAAIHNDTINKYLDIKKGVGLESDLFEIDVFSGIRSVIGHESEPVMVVDMGAGTTKLAVVDNGILRMQHIVNMGSQDVTMTYAKTFNIDVSEAENLKRSQGLEGERDGQTLISVGSMPLNHIFTQITKVMVEYKKKSRRPVSKIILTGGGVLMNGFHDAMKKHIDVTIEYGKPFDKIETPVFLEDTLRDAGPVFAVAVGLAIKALID